MDGRCAEKNKYIHQLRFKNFYRTDGKKCSKKLSLHCNVSLLYKADTLEQEELRLDDLEAKWGKKYEKVIESRRNSWPKLTSYFRYDSAVRRLICTSNTIEGFHRQVC